MQIIIVPAGVRLETEHDFEKWRRYVVMPNGTRHMVFEGVLEAMDLNTYVYEQG